VLCLGPELAGSVGVAAQLTASEPCRPGEPPPKVEPAVQSGPVPWRALRLGDSGWGLLPCHLRAERGAKRHVTGGADGKLRYGKPVLPSSKG
jgi:hypothetical protein